jgi:hypothetical protein
VAGLRRSPGHGAVGGGLTRNQVELMQRDNVVDAAGNLQELGVRATPFEATLPALVSASPED